MEKMKQLQFDFRGDAGLDDLARLEGILCSSHWSERGINYKDVRTVLLIRLLQIGGVKIYKRLYDRKTDYSPEIR
jgi:hypothetical protein